MWLTGKDTDFTAYFNADQQTYTVYYKGKVLVKDKHKYSQIQSYLQ